MPKASTVFNVADAKRHFADLLGRVAYGGETITITRRGKPMAQLVPVDADARCPARRRCAGMARGRRPLFYGDRHHRGRPGDPSPTCPPAGRPLAGGMYLLDTNALSELLKKRPKPQFLTRLRRHPPDMFFTSSICVMELRHGSRRREDHAVFWQRIAHEVLSRGDYT